MVWTALLSGVAGSTGGGGGMSGQGKTSADSGGSLTGMFSNSGISFGGKSKAQTYTDTAVKIAALVTVGVVLFAALRGK